MSASLSPLWERYVRAKGRVHLTGQQALVRIAVDQVRRDRKAGRRVGALFSGYPGSPLAGLDMLLRTLEPILTPEDVRFAPAVNEELAASTIGGTQLVDLFPHESFDGVLGLWFGKAPGLDRALDAMRHSNFMGTSRFGGALALVGDDPYCKSSSLPSHSEHALAHAFVPCLHPTDAGDVLSLARHAFAISRYAGTWVALKVAADVADGGAIVTLPEDEPEVMLPKFQVGGRDFEKRLDPGLLPPVVNRIEEELIYQRLEAVRIYAEANGLNPITTRSSRDRVGMIASGRLYRELVTALDLMDLRREDLDRFGIRVMKLDTVYPTPPRRLREFADGLDEILVIDERRGFIEDQVRATLFNEVDRPQIFGQRDHLGSPWLARHREVSAETLALDIAPHLSRRFERPDFERRVAWLRQAANPRLEVASGLRRPFFCSGCPHSTSTKVPEGSVAGGGIGCHTMALFMDREIQFIGAMGSEGAQWIGLAPYTETEHLFQNLGDGTYCHSGRMAVRAAAESGVNMTYKLLYNGFVAMTGGQEPVGMKPVAEIARDMLSDGVRKVVAMTDDPTLVSMAEHDRRIEVIGRTQYEGAMEALRKERGVTALIYDSVCANQKHRLERRGVIPKTTERVIINRDVCEGCGDCGAKTSCLSLWPVETTLGRKTHVHRASCTDDRACIDGDCPAFATVALPPVPDAARRELESYPLDDPPPPLVDCEDRVEVYFVGIGSTGVVSVDAILVHAAQIEGLHALHLDQTGLAQRGGKVVSHCVLSRKPIDGSPRVSWGRADAFFALDPIGACDVSALRELDPMRTRVVLSETTQPTAEMVANRDAEMPSAPEVREMMRRRSRDLTSLQADALADAVLGETIGASVVALGAALQLGWLPVSVAAVECAIRDREIAVESNLLALRLGRVAVAAPELAARWIADATAPGIGDAGSIEDARKSLGPAWERLESTWKLLPRPSRDALLECAASFGLDLVDYQDRAYAARYLETLGRVVAAEAKLAPKEVRLAPTVARELYRAMAYKDEYEVARLLVRGPFRRWIERRYGRVRLDYRLEPPLLRKLGLDRKLRVSSRLDPLLGALAGLRRLRGTLLDPFGFLPSRRAERDFVGWYEDVIARVLEGLDGRKLDLAEEILAAPARVRGFEGVKRAREVELRAWMKRKIETY